MTLLPATSGGMIGRRAFLTGGSTLAVAACAPCPDLVAISRPPAIRPLADSHAHLFNAADLPVLRFIKYVVAPVYLDKWPGVVLAIGNVLLWALKRTAMPANAEMRLTVPPWRAGEGGRVTARAFADEVADQVERVLAATDPALLVASEPLALLPDLETPTTEQGEVNRPPLCRSTQSSVEGPLSERFDAAGESEQGDPDTQVSMVLLATMLAARTAQGSARLADIAGSEGLESDLVRARDLLRAVMPVDRAGLQHIIEDRQNAAEAELAAPVHLPNFLLRRLGPAAPVLAQPVPGQFERAAFALASFDVWTIIQWGYRMRQTRCSHLFDYLDFIEQRAPFRATALVNLLVDYDEWLGEAPAPGSGHREQIAFWHHMRQAAAPRIDLQTFAGFDPLKETWARLEGQADGDQTIRQSPYLDHLIACYQRHVAGGMGAEPTIQGLKLYPVMGFNPNRGNRLPSTQLAGRRVRRRWESRDDGRDFGRELDASLDHFFAKVAEHGIPLLTHARQSNQATECGNQYARLRHWRERAERHYAVHQKPLRLCLGHFTVNDTDVAELAKILQMNNARPPQAEIYIDLSFGFSADDNAICLPDWDDCYAAFVKEAVETHDEDCRFVLFGTDWIMLDQVKEADGYVASAWRQLSKDGFFREGDRLDNIFHRNFARFTRVLDRP